MEDSSSETARRLVSARSRSRNSSKTTGILEVSGRAPDGLTWEGPFGVIEKPLPLLERENVTGGSLAREERTSYGSGQQPSDSVGVVSLDERSRDHYPEGNKTSTDHVVTEVGASRRNRKTPSLSAKPWGVPDKKPSQHLFYLSFAADAIREADGA